MIRIGLGILVMAVTFSEPVAGDDPGNPPVTKNQLPDTIFLKSGGELKGKIVSELKGETNGRAYMVFRTESGGLLKLDQARLIKRQQKANEEDAEYLRRLKIAGDDPNLLWKVYEWCQSQDAGAARYKGELKFLLQRITELDKNDDRARRLLGFDLVDGRWVREEQLYGNHGYQKRGTSWAPELMNDVEAQTDLLKQKKSKKGCESANWING